MMLNSNVKYVPIPGHIIVVTEEILFNDALNTLFLLNADSVYVITSTQVSVAGNDVLRVLLMSLHGDVFSVLWYIALNSYYMRRCNIYTSLNFFT